jgi:flagellar assembly factor FliW
MWKPAFFTVYKDLLFHKPFKSFEHRNEFIIERISEKMAHLLNKVNG